MNMSLLMVQPLADAGKNAAAGAGSKGQGNETGNSFQTLLDGRMTERAPESAPTSASASETPAEPVSDASAQQPSQPEKGAETESASASGKVGEKEETASARQDEKGEVQVVPEGDAAVLAQIMAAMGGVQQVQAEVAAASADETAGMTDEGGVPVLSAVSGEAAEDGLPLPVMADAGGGGSSQGRQDGKDDGAAYARVQAAAGQKVSDAEGRMQAAEETDVSGSRADAAAVDAEKAAATPAAAAPATASSAAAISSGAADARPMPVSQQGALPVSSEQAVFMQPVAQTAAVAQPANAGQVEARIMQPMGTPEWNQAIGQRVLWMVGQEQQSASLTLNPPDLGPVRVVVSVSNNHASANFFSANPDVRQALEGSLPRLREMMEGAGIQLGQAQVGAENSGGFQQESGASGRTASSGGNGTEGEGGSLAGVTGAAGTAQPAQVVSRGLVDTFV